MANNFSSKFNNYNRNLLPKSVESSITQLERIVYKNNVRLFKFSDDYIGVSFSLDIPLPSRGTHNNIDIREVEDIFIIFKIEDFSYIAPSAFSDRVDFPTELLPHLNPLPNGSPANFCLHRGEINEWYAEHTLIEFVERIRSWLKDAASNRLIKIGQGDSFEPIRINNSVGYIVYNPKELIFQILNLFSENEFLFSWIEIIKDDPLVSNSKKMSVSLKSLGVVQQPILNDVIDLAKRINGLENNSETLNKQSIGIILFNKSKNVTSKYFSNLPSKYSELIQLCNELELPIKESISFYLENNYQCLKIIPLTIAIQRPNKLINSESNIELINFLILNNDDYPIKDNELNSNTPIFVLENRIPVTLKLAQELSNNENDLSKDKSLIIGCGAVGSKLSLHLAKSGFNNFDLVDGDFISPHNLIRFGLLSKSVGKNKAQAICEEVSNLFYADKSSINWNSINTSGQEYINSKKSFSEYSHVIDCTASNSFQNYLADNKKLDSAVCIRCEIADDGNLGILKIEGHNRNPRLDELNISLLDFAIDDANISNWLNNYKSKVENGKFEFEEINIGIGCNSNTLKLSDDIISLHSSIFSLGIKKGKRDTKGGIIQIAQLSEGNEISTRTIQVSSFITTKFRNDSNWKLHVNSNVVTGINNELVLNSPNETGGLLIGRIDIKRKIVYITRFTKAPKDSIVKPYLFTRGIHQVPQEVEIIRSRTAGYIDYVGEWHTHPTGGSQLSSTDKQAITELRSSLDKIPYPTFIIIATPNKINPYIFGPKPLIH